MTHGVLDLAARATLLLLVTWGAAMVVERSGSSAAKRHAVWAGGFAALALLPLCSRLLPRLPLPILPVEPAAAALPAFAPALAPTVTAIAPVFDPSAVLSMLYLSIAALLVGRIIAGRFLLSRLWQKAAPLFDPAKLELTRSLCASLHIRRDVGVRISGSAIVPMT